jgi:FkbM family methyltransferase
MLSAINVKLAKLLNCFGYRLNRIRSQRPSKVIPINVLPLVVQDLRRRKGACGENGGDDFFFIQIGAHDGLHNDPVRPFVMRYHWRGILVEPQPRIFKRLVANYKTEPQLIFENAAIASQNGKIALYAFRETAALPDHATMLASLYRDALVNNGHNYKGEIEEISVPAITMNELIAKHHVKQIDLLQIDTEGYDFNIIMMLSDVESKPAIIHFESAFMTGDQSFLCGESLSRWGYRVLTIGIDTIAYRQEDNDNFAEILENKGYGLI